MRRPRLSTDPARSWALMRTVVPKGLTVVLGVVALSAHAHDADVVYARLEQLDATSMVEVVTLTNATLGLLAPVDADGDGLLSQADLDARAEAIEAGVWDDLPLSAGGRLCGRSDEVARLDDGFVTLSATWRCGEGTLRQDFKILRILPTNYRVVLGSQSMGERGRQFAQGVFTALELPRPGAQVIDSARLASGFRRGIADSVTLEGLVALAVIALSTRRRQRLLAGWAMVIGGAALTCSVPRGNGWAGPLLVVASFLSVAILEDTWRGWLVVPASALLGAGLGVRAGSWVWDDALGWLLALVLTATIIFAIAWPVGGLLSRRPRSTLIVRWCLVAALCFTAGLRLAAR